MNIEKIIADLLYEYDAVTLPGFGGLTLQTHAAEIDQAAEIIHPPSKKVRFNPNLVLNDGFLTARIRERYRIPQESAEQRVQHFVQGLKDQLEQGNTVQLDQIGRFFKSGDQIQFSASAVNYDKSTYGLPDVKSERIATDGSEALAFHTVAESDESTKTTASPTEYGRILQWAIPLLAILVVALIIFTLKDDLFSDKSSLKDDLEDRELINKSPSEDVAPLSDEEMLDEQEESAGIEASTPSPNQKEKKIVVGAFSEKKNAEKLARRIQLAGYASFSENRNGKRYVGVNYAYEEEEEFERAFSDIKKRFSSGAWILTE